MRFLRSLSALLVSTLVAATALAQRVVPAERIGDVSVRELAARPSAPPLARETRHAEKHHPAPALPGPSGKARVVANATAAATIPAPAIALGFHAQTSKLVSPADSSGAAGPRHIVGLTNGGLSVHDRRGNVLAQLWINQFWGDPNNSNEYYDPRIAYDEANDRWIAMSVFEEQSLMLGISATGDPLGTWFRYRLPLQNVDFSRIALTRTDVVISTMHFQGDVISDIGEMFVFPKDGFYSGAPTLSSRGYVVRSSAVPVDAPESNIAYTVEASDSELVIRRLGDPDFRAIADAGFQWEFSWDDYAPQLGTSIRLDTGYPEAVAVIRKGALYVVHKIGLISAKGMRSSILWWKVNPVTGERLDSGTIDDPSGATQYAFPSIAVNRAGAALITYCSFSNTQFPSAGYVYRDAAGRVSAPAVLKNGVTAATMSERWGDYTTTVVDPLNGNDFWAATIYGKDATWGTWWANVKLAPGKTRSVRK